jgi:hypothetical protein
MILDNHSRQVMKGGISKWPLGSLEGIFRPFGGCSISTVLIEEGVAYLVVANIGYNYMGKRN